MEKERRKEGGGDGKKKGKEGDRQQEREEEGEEGKEEEEGEERKRKSWEDEWEKRRGRQRRRIKQDNAINERENGRRKGGHVHCTCIIHTVYMCNLDSKSHKMWKGVMGMRLVVVTGHTNLRDD